MRSGRALAVSAILNLVQLRYPLESLNKDRLELPITLDGVRTGLRLLAAGHPRLGFEVCGLSLRRLITAVPCPKGYLMIYMYRGIRC